MAQHANSVASRFLAIADEEGIPLTNMQLLKLVFLAQSAHVHDHGAPAFVESVEAWEHGPVVGSVYRTYKSYGGRPISAIANIPSAHEPVAESVEESIEQVWRLFARQPAAALRGLTHDLGPWPKHYRSDTLSIALPNAEVGDAWPAFKAKGVADVEALRASAESADERVPAIPGYFASAAQYADARSRFNISRPTKSVER